MSWSRRQGRSKRLSAHMISSPLGDFRHLAHMGMDLRREETSGDIPVPKQGGSLVLLQGRWVTTDGSPPPPPPPLTNPLQEMDRQPPPRNTGVLLQEAAKEKLSFTPRKEELRVRCLDMELSSLRPDLTTKPSEEDQVDELEELELDMGTSLLEEMLRVMDGLL